MVWRGVTLLAMILETPMKDCYLSDQSYAFKVIGKCVSSHHHYICK